MKTKKPPPSHRDVLNLRPLRNPSLEWSEQDGQVVIHVTHPRNSWKMKLINVFIDTPRGRNIVLDQVGTDIWKEIDGERTFAQLAQMLAKKHKLTAREAEISLQQFFKELVRRGYIAFKKP
jgi:hypothetical protein